MTTPDKARPFSDGELSDMRARVASIFKGPPEGLDLTNALRVMREVAGEIRYEAERWLATVEQRDAEIERLREALGSFSSEMNWRQGGPFDPNSPSFTGTGVASAALKEPSHD